MLEQISFEYCSGGKHGCFLGRKLGAREKWEKGGRNKRIFFGLLRITEEVDALAFELGKSMRKGEWQNTE